MKKSLNNSSMWDVKPIKLSILVPTRDTVHSHFAYCLTQLVRTTSEAGIDTYLFFDSNTNPYDYGLPEDSNPITRITDLRK